jgi:O-antigen biosynthesis protein WbqP
MLGITGWAQINGHDELPIADKVVLDIEYMNLNFFLFDLKILCIIFFIGH